MGDLQACMWRSVVFFVATTRNHFSEVVVLVDKRSGPETLTIPKQVQDNYSGFWIVVVLLALYGIEQSLFHVSKRKPLSQERCCIVEEEVAHKEDEKVQEICTATRNVQIEYLSTDVADKLLSLLDETLKGITEHSPQKAKDGTSGVYFLKDSTNNNCAVFKPADEEASHLEGYEGGEIKPGCMPGEGYLKEVAASIIDKDGFHGVPSTTLAKCAHDVFDNNGVPGKKVGSLQTFVPSKCTAEDMGWGKFSTRDVHKIGLLDCRILNLDRHLGNMLVREEGGAYRLVPIDHALSFPSSITGGTFEWLSFPQCKQPFDEETVNFICNIDVDSDVQMLRRQLPDMKEECIDTMKICTIFLKKAVAKGFNLYEIGCMMSRYRDEEEATDLERMYIRVTERMAQGDRPFWGLVEEEIEQVLNHK